MGDHQKSENPIFTTTEGRPTGEHHEITPAEKKARDRRNVFMALGVVAFIILVYSTTLLRITQNIGGAQ
ncbi:MAG: protoheme IX farnesyltransferase [Pseudomonadota bacterium]